MHAKTNGSAIELLAMRTPTQFTLPNYRYVFNFESEFTYENNRKWMAENWTLGFYFVGIYVILIFGGKYLMQNRPKFELRGALSLWNVTLATFSVMGACRIVHELVHGITQYGLYHSVCIPTFLEQDPVSGFWIWMYVLSKVPELGDTIFVVLRKQPLMFLHWYHHATVLLYAWFSYSPANASSRWFIAINYCVHAAMYTYYALRSMGYNPPRQIAMVITLVQLLQMVVGCAINYWAHRLLQNQVECHISPLNVKVSTAMYFSYFVLFARFFYKAYLSGGRRSKNINTTADHLKSKVH